QRDVGHSVCGDAANRVRGAGEQCLIHGTRTEQMRATAAAVTDLEHQVACELCLQTHAVALQHRRARIQIDDRESTACCRRVCRKTRKRYCRWERIRECRRSILCRRETREDCKRRSREQLDERLSG